MTNGDSFTPYEELFKDVLTSVRELRTDLHETREDLAGFKGEVRGTARTTAIAWSLIISLLSLSLTAAAIFTQIQ